MSQEPLDHAEEEALDSLLEIAARETLHESPAGLPDRIIARIHEEERKDRLVRTLLIAASLTVLVVGSAVLFFPQHHIATLEPINSEQQVILAQATEEIVPLTAFSLTFASLLPETEKALRQNRDGFIDHGRSVHNIAILLASTQRPDVMED